jgi:K+-transporting ATPase ATPase B chain
MTLQPGTIVLVETGKTIPANGKIIEGVALIDESAVTGQTDPLLCEAGGCRSDVVAGAQVVAGQIRVRIE